MTNRPINFNDPTGHAGCDGDYQGSCADWAESLEYQSQGGGGDGNDDGEITITVSRDKLIEVINTSDDLAEHYTIAGNWWGYGTGTVVAVGMLFIVDAPACIVGGLVTFGTSCVAAIALTATLSPGAGYAAGQVGGHLQANAYNTISEYLEDVLINDPSDQFTLTFTQDTQTTIILPGGVGPTEAVYIISVVGASDFVQVNRWYGGNAINTLFFGDNP